MKRSTLKLVVAIAVLLVVSAVVALWSSLAAAVVFVIVCLNVLSRHLDRCNFCGSWRTTTKETWHPDDSLPGWNEATGVRICRRCRRQEVDHYLLRDMNPFRL